MSVTVQEFGTIAAAIKAAWPNANIMPDNKSKDIWYTMLHDIEYPICLNAIKQLMSTSKFAPSIAEIRERCAGVCHETRDIAEHERGYTYLCEAYRFPKYLPLREYHG